MSSMWVPLCPYCGYDGLTYGTRDWMNEFFVYNVKCTRCEKEFYEWYKLEFAGYTDRDGNDLDEWNDKNE